MLQAPAKYQAEPKLDSMKRGEIWWTYEDEIYPVVILSLVGANDTQAMKIIATAITDIRDMAIEIKIGADEGISHIGVLRVALTRPGRINCNCLVTLMRADLFKYAGSLSSAKLRELEDALRRGGIDYY